MDVIGNMLWNMATYAGKADAALLILKASIKSTDRMAADVKKDLLNTIDQYQEELSILWANRTEAPKV